MFWEFFKKNLICIIVFVVAFCIRAYAIHTKNYLFVDSPYSITCSTPNNILENKTHFKKDWDKYDFQTGKTYKLSEIKTAIFYNEASIKSVVNDLYSIASKPLDRFHPSLYFSILRVWNIGIDGLNTKQMINRGCALNLLFFTLSFFFMYKLLSLIREDKNFIAMGLFFAFISTGTISNTLLIREYALMEPLMIASVYIFACIDKKILNNEVLKEKDYIISIITITLFSLSGYFSNLLSVLLFIVLLLDVLKQGNKKYLKYLTIVPFFVILAIFILDPGYVYIFSNPHSGVVNNNLSDLLAYNNVVNFLNVLFHYLFYNICIYILIALFALFIPTIKNHKTFIQDNGKILILLVYIWSYIVLAIQPWKDSMSIMHTIRFIAPALPVMSLLLLNFTYKYNKYIQVLIISVFLLTSIRPLIIEYVYPAFKDKSITYNGTLTYHNNYSNLDLHTKIPDLDSKTHKNLVIVNPNWDYVNFILYLPNDYNVRFEKQDPKGKYVFDNYLLMNGQSGSVKISEEYFTVVEHNQIAISK